MELSLNELSKQLYPQPMLQPNFQVDELFRIRKDMKSSESVIQKVRNKSFHKIQAQSPKIKQIKVTEQVLKIREQKDKINKPIVEQRQYDYHDHYQQYVESEKRFKAKELQIQQMVKEKLYMSYCNTIRNKKNPKKEITNKMKTLEPNIPDHMRLKSPHQKRMEQFLNLNRATSYHSQTQKKIVLQTESLPRLDLSLDTIHINKNSKQQRELFRICQKINKLGKITKMQLPSLNPQPIIEYQQKLLQTIDLKNSTKQKLMEKFKEVLENY